MNEIKHLFSAETNAMRLYFVENYTTGQAICVDWDLSDEEEQELINAFENGTLDETANGQNWGNPDDVYGDTFSKHMLS